MICGEGVSYENGTFVVNDTSSSIKLIFEGLNDSETYLGLYNMHFSFPQLSDIYSEEEWAEFGLIEKVNLVLDDRRQWKAHTIPLNIELGNLTRSVLYRMPDTPMYTGKHNYLVNLFHNSEETAEIEIHFVHAGVYSFDLEIVSQPMERLGSQVDQLREVILEDVNISANRVTGTIHSDRDKLLCLSIPYSKGWSAYLNGEKVELLNVNTMFSGIYVPAGNYEVTLTYITPYLVQGGILSLVGVCLFVAIILYHRKRKIT